MMDESYDKNTGEPVDWKLCIFCQKSDSSKGDYVQNPKAESYQKVIDVVAERASLHDGEFVSIQIRLQGCTKEMLLENKATWHRSCYSSATHPAKLQRARDRFKHSMSSGQFAIKKPGYKRSSTEMDADTPGASKPFTRSATTPLLKDQCFFCQSDTGQPLFTIRTENSGKTLRQAIDISQDPVLMTRLSTAISPSDAHAIDVMYHKQCWTKHVFHVIRDHTSDKAKCTTADLPMQMSCLIELINLIDIQTKNKAYLPMDEVERTYISMLGGSEEAQKHTPMLTRQWLKDTILQELPSVKSVRQKDRRKPSVLYCPAACEEDMVHMSMLQDHASEIDSMKFVYKTANLVRRSIVNFTNKKKQSDMINVLSSAEDVPPELYSLIRWIMVGPEEELQTETRSRTVHQSALTITQNIMYAFKTKRQVQHQPKEETETFRIQHARENPQVLGLALTVHHDTRNKKLIDLLHSHNYCVPYGRSLLLETAIANAVVENTRQFDGLYVPHFLKKGTFVFFAVDNTDFAEDTADGKGTTHGTITAIYQKANAPGEVIAPSLKLKEAKSLSVDPYHVPIKPCSKPKPGLVKRAQKFEVSTSGVAETYRLTTLGWIVASALSRENHGEESKIPGWAGFKSLLSSGQSLTHVGALPLLPEVAHEWSTMLTVILQASQLRSLVVGEEHPTVITFDMALYEKAVQLLDSRDDLKRTVLPRLGELHTVMAALRALGTSIENSGIDDAWIEADVYGHATTRQILKCAHYKRTLRAHIHTYMALYELLLDKFFTEKPNLKSTCSKAVTDVQDACARSAVDKSASPEGIANASDNLLQTLSEEDVIEQLKTWEAEKCSTSAMFKSLTNYLHHVETILFFIEASRNSDLVLHLQAGEALSKLFFALDRIKYKRLWPRYLADMQELKISHPETWRELDGGNISVTKSEIPFVSIGADHACEQLNRMMKVHSGLIGISNNANARQRFFMATPEMSRLSTEFKDQFGVTAHKAKEHHEVQPSAIRKEHEAVNKIKAAILSHGNPFDAEGDQLYNFMTHAYVPQEFVPQILNIDKIGQELYKDYVAERINGTVSLWAPVKKQNNAMFLSGNKRQTVKVRDKSVDLTETKELFGRFMVLARSNRDIDQKNAIGNYEFTLTPRALFAPDGSVLPCNDKSKLIHCLEHLSNTHNETHQSEQTPASGESKKIAIVDGMVLVQQMTKTRGTISTVKDLCQQFNKKLLMLTADFEEINLVFDTYRMDSMKQKTREKRRHGKDPIQYQVADDTKIGHIPMARFLSHDKTKSDLTDYLAEAILEMNKNSAKLFITSASGHTRSNQDMEFEENNHEEADTLMICLAAAASQRSPNARIVFFSPDTDVLVLAVANFEKLCKNTAISMVSGTVEIEPIWNSLGRDKAAALPAFHAFTGADTVGRFAGIGKTKWFQQYLKIDSDIIAGLMTLSEEGDLTQEGKDALANFVCMVYCQKGIHITSIPDLRWHLFCKNLAESSKLPPTIGALEEHIERAHVQTRVWSQATVMWQNFLDPLKHGYYQKSHGEILPITTKVPPAPLAIVELIRCRCKTQCATQRCSCRRHNLACTELCLCGSDCENDADINAEHDTPDSDGEL